MENKILTDNSSTITLVILQAKYKELLALVEQKSSLIEQKDHRIKILEEALILSRVKRFAPSSEQSNGQMSLFDEAEVDSDIDSSTQENPESKNRP